jgi:hypothetical protein
MNNLSHGQGIDIDKTYVRHGQDKDIDKTSVSIFLSFCHDNTFVGEIRHEGSIVAMHI